MLGWLMKGEELMVCRGDPKSMMAKHKRRTAPPTSIMLLGCVLLLVAFSSWICLFPKTMMAMQEMAEMMLAGDTWLAVVKVTRKKPSTTVTLLATFNRACWIGLNMLKITVMLMMLYVAWNNPDDTSMATVALCRLMKVDNRRTTE